MPSNLRAVNLHIPPSFHRLQVWVNKAQLVKARNVLSEALNYQGKKPYTKSFLRPSASAHLLVRKHKGEYSIVLSESVLNVIRPSWEKTDHHQLSALLEQFQSAIKEL